MSNICRTSNAVKLTDKEWVKQAKLKKMLDDASSEMAKTRPTFPTIALEQHFAELNASPGMKNVINRHLGSQKDDVNATSTLQAPMSKSVVAFDMNATTVFEEDNDKGNVGDEGQRSIRKERLRTETFDILVIGGGATGLGCALDASRRGYNVAVIDRGDWAEGTSSKSSNMHHGGVRYLQAFVNNPEGAEEQLRVVKNGLAEQQYLYHCAPYLVKPAPIMVPCYSEEEKSNFGKLLAKYDELGADDPYPDSYWSSKKETLFRFPQLKPEGLEGAWTYYDAEQDDARMALLIALTAAEAGCCTLNYTEVTRLKKDEEGKVVGAICHDAESLLNHDDEEEHGIEEFVVNAKVIINATGPFSDSIRKMDSPTVAPIIKPSAGTHIILPAHFAPVGTGMAILETSDGRAMFYLPWQGRTLIGTTDYLSPLDKWPKPPMSDVNFILKEVNRFLSQETSPAKESDVLAAWVGIRPLAVGTQTVTGTAETEASDPNDDTKEEDAAATKKVSREHIVSASPSGLTIAGGKWTSYRHMAEDTIDFAVSSGDLHPPPNNDYKSSADNLINLVGCKGPSNAPAEHISQANAAPFHHNVVELLDQYHVDPVTAEKLNESYGSNAKIVCELAQNDKSLRKRLSHQYPWIMAQVVYACRYEHARTATDVLSRRTRLAQVDVIAAHNATPKVVRLMAEELGWNGERRMVEIQRTKEFLESCGLEMRMKHVTTSREQQRLSLWNFKYGGDE